MGNKDENSHRGGAWFNVPPHVGEERDLPRLQGVEYSSGWGKIQEYVHTCGTLFIYLLKLNFSFSGFPRKAVRFWACKIRPI